MGFGAIALAALLTVNVGIATSNESTNALLTLKGLEAMAYPGAELEPIGNYEDCYCENGKVGCTAKKRHTCETGILCSPLY